MSVIKNPISDFIFKLFINFLLAIIIFFIFFIFFFAGSIGVNYSNSLGCNIIIKIIVFFISGFLNVFMIIWYFIWKCRNDKEILLTLKGTGDIAFPFF